MGFLSDIFYFVIVIGILILIHELGHFLAARLSGMRTEVFSIGMGWRLFGFNKVNGFTFGPLPKDFELGEYTDYRIAIFPIGGYVKISGMIDESMDTDFAGKPAEPYEFRAKNAFQKTFVLSAGVIMNALLAIGIFAGIVFFNGEQSFKTTTICYVQSNSVAEMVGLEAGDRIINVNGEKVNNWSDVLQSLTTKDFGKTRNITIVREGEKATLSADGDKLIRAFADKKTFGIEPIGVRPYIVAAIFDKPAQKAGIQANDTILRVNSEPITAFTHFVDILKANPNKKLLVEWKRGEKIISDSIRTDERGTIGVQIGQAFLGELYMKKYGFFESIGFGYNQTVSSVSLLFSSIGQMISGNMSFKESVGGPIMIAKQASRQAELGVVSFLSFMALLSVSLAVLNILPFPALDGGHIVFVVIEGIIRRELPLKLKLAFQQTGLIILLLFMAFVLYNDIIR